MLDATLKVIGNTKDELRNELLRLRTEVDQALQTLDGMFSSGTVRGTSLPPLQTQTQASNGQLHLKGHSQSEMVKLVAQQIEGPFTFAEMLEKINANGVKVKAISLRSAWKTLKQRKELMCIANGNRHSPSKWELSPNAKPVTA